MMSMLVLPTYCIRGLVPDNISDHPMSRSILLRGNDDSILLFLFKKYIIYSG